MSIEVGAAYLSILPSTNKLATGIKKELNSVEKSSKASGLLAGTGFATSFAGSVNKVLKKGLLAGVAGASLLAGAGLKTAAELEQSKIGFETMLGSAKEADKFLKQIKDTAKKTPFELTGLTQASQKLLAFGFDVKDVIPMMTTLGDAASGLGIGQEGLDRIILAIGQMKAKGKVTGEEMRQLTEAGIPAQRILQNELGLTNEEYEKMQRSGQILADKAIPKLLNGIKNGTKGVAGETRAFGGLMEKQSKSLTGLFSNLKDVALTGMADALEPLIPMIKTGLAGAIKHADTAFAALGATLRTSFAFFGKHRDIVIAVGSALLTAATATYAVGTAIKVAAVAQRILNAAMWSSPVTWYIAALAALVGAFVLAYRKSETFRKITDRTWAQIKTAIGKAWKQIKPVLTDFRRWITKVLTPALKRFWTGVIKPIFKLIGKTIKAAWKTVILPALKAWWKYITKVVIPGIKLLARMVRLHFRVIQTVIRTAWRIIRPLLSAWRTFMVRVLVPAVRTLLNAVRSGFNTMRSLISTAWNRGIRPALVAFRSYMIGPLVSACRSAVNAIKSSWSSLKEAARKPVEFVVNTVYQNGIRKVVNAIPGVKDLPSLHFARGGAVFGGVKGKDSVRAMLMPGEHVLTTEEVNKLGGHRAVYRLRELIRDGRFNPSKKGGDLGWPAQDQHVPGFAKGGALSPAQIARGLAFARAQAGKPYIWGGVGPGGYDCSGFMSAITNAILGRNPYSRVGTSSSFPWPGFLPGWGQFTIGAFTGSPGHVAGTLAGVNVESTNGSVRVGPAARGAGNSMFTRIAHLGAAGPPMGGGGDGGKYAKFYAAFDKIKDLTKSLTGSLDKLKGMGEWGDMMKSMASQLVSHVKDMVKSKAKKLLGGFDLGIFDQGGILPPGGMAVNLSKRPEAVFNNSQFRALAEAGSDGGGTRYCIVQIGEREFEGYMTEVAEEVYDSETSFESMTRRMY